LAKSQRQHRPLWTFTAPKRAEQHATSMPLIGGLKKPTALGMTGAGSPSAVADFNWNGRNGQSHWFRSTSAYEPPNRPSKGRFGVKTGGSGERRLPGKKFGPGRAASGQTLAFDCVADAPRTHSRIRVNRNSGLSIMRSTRWSRHQRQYTKECRLVTVSVAIWPRIALASFRGSGMSMHIMRVSRSAPKSIDDYALTGCFGDEVARRASHGGPHKEGDPHPPDACRSLGRRRALGRRFSNAILPGHGHSLGCLMP
jgi:hypothetical protein